MSLALQSVTSVKFLLVLIADTQGWLGWVDPEMAVRSTLCLKKHPDVIDCNLKKDCPILVIVGTNIFYTTGHQTTIQVPRTPPCASALPGKNQNKQWNEQKTSQNFISLYCGPQQLVDHKWWWLLGVLMHSTSDWWSLDWQNFIDTAINEWKKRLRVHVCITSCHFWTFLL